MEKKQIILLVIESVVILLFLLFIGSGIVVSPFFGDINMIDEGQFGGWIAHMLHGKHLYKDVYAAYGPLYIYPLYIFSKLFGPSVFLIRIVYIVLNTFIAVLIARTVLRTIKVSLVLEIIALALLLIVPGFGMRQGVGLLAIILSFYAMKEKKLAWSVASGVAIANSFLVSSEIGIFTTITCGLLFIYKLVTEEKAQDILRKLSLVVLSVCIIFLLFFLWANGEGWLHAYLQTILDDFQIYSGIALPNGQNFPNALQLLPQNLSVVSWAKFSVSQKLLLYWLFLFYLITFLFLFVRLALRKSKQTDLLIFLIAVYGFFLSMILIGRYGHFPFTLSPVFILFAYYLNILVNIFIVSKKRNEKTFSALLIVIICLFSARVISIYRPHFSKILSVPQAFVSTKNSPKYVGNVTISSSQTKAILTLQNFIDENTKLTDTVFFFNNEPMMYLMVNRDNPTRYDLPEVAVTKEKRLEMLNDLIENRTRYIIDDTQAWSVDNVSNRRRLPEVYEYMQKEYNKRKLDNFIIYTRKDG